MCMYDVVTNLAVWMRTKTFIARFVCMCVLAEEEISLRRQNIPDFIV